MKVRDTSLGLDTTVNYTFEYDGLGKLQKMFYNGKLLYEWNNNSTNELSVRYFEASGNSKDYLVKVDNNIIKSISSEFETIYESQNSGNNITQAQIASNCFLGIYPIIGGSSDFVTSNFLIENNQYSYDLDFTSYAFPPFSNEDSEIHIECAIEKLEMESSISLPMQGFEAMGLWFEGVQNIHEYKLLFFLASSGFHIWKDDIRLTDKWTTFGETFIEFDYQKNNLDQISEMQYGYDDVISGRFEFEYY
jgi:hypothetical protein